MAGGRADACRPVRRVLGTRRSCDRQEQSSRGDSRFGLRAEHTRYSQQLYYSSLLQWRGLFSTNNCTQCSRVRCSMLTHHAEPGQCVLCVQIRQLKEYAKKTSTKALSEVADERLGFIEVSLKRNAGRASRVKSCCEKRKRQKYRI